MERRTKIIAIANQKHNIDQREHQNQQNIMSCVLILGGQHCPLRGLLNLGGCK